jgi:hypothetical protein
MMRRLVLGVVPWLWSCAFGANSPLPPVEEPAPDAPPDGPSVSEPAPSPAPGWADQSEAFTRLVPRLMWHGCDPRVGLGADSKPCVARPMNVETLLSGPFRAALPPEELRWLFAQSAASTARHGLLICRVETREALVVTDGVPKLLVRYRLLSAGHKREEGLSLAAPLLNPKAETARAAAYIAIPLASEAMELHVSLETSKERWTLASFDESGVIVPAKLPAPARIASADVRAAERGRHTPRGLGGAECRFVDPALVERRVNHTLAALDAMLERWEHPEGDLSHEPAALREQLREQTEPHIGHIVSLVGWTDPRLLQRLERALRAMEAHDEAASAAQWAATPAVSTLTLDGAQLSIRALSAPTARVVDPPDDMQIGIPPDRLYLLDAPIVLEITVSERAWKVYTGRLALMSLPREDKRSFGFERSIEPSAITRNGEPIQGGELTFEPGDVVTVAFGGPEERVWRSELHTRRVWRLGSMEERVVVRSP